MRFLRKHRAALVALGVYHFIFFFPTLFMHRVPSPNDVFFNYSPWSDTRHVDAQNSLLNDPPTSYFTLMSLLKSDRESFHWNPYIGSGVPGFGSSASAVLSPFVLLPTFLLPLAWVYAGMLILKLNTAFFFAYLWVREERLGRRNAAAGAIVIAAAGAYAVRWWWQATNATALYPALLWIVARVMRGRRVPVWAVVAITVSYAVAGFPAAMLYGIDLAILYAIFLALVVGRRPSIAPALAILLAVLIAMPAIVPFVQLLGRSGYLEARANASKQTFPVRHLASFVFPDRLGNNAYHDWRGDGALGASNNYIAATVYLGLITLALIAAAAAARRVRMRWFWFAVMAGTLAAMFGLPLISTGVAHLPYLTYSPLTQLALLLPLPAGYLAAAGASLLTKRSIALASLIAALCAADLGVFAGRFYPYITADLTSPPRSETLEFLQAQKRPFRIAPMLGYLWPNTAELYRIEDVRSHFSSEALYRKLLHRIDPTSSSGQHTVVSFNSLQYNFADPLSGMLGIRYYVEHKGIDILRWTIFKESEPLGPSNGTIVLQPGMTLARQFTIDDRPFYALDVPVTLRQTQPPGASIVATLSQGGRILFRRAFTPGDLGAMNKIYIPIYEHLRPGDRALVEVRSNGLRAELVRGADQPLFCDRVKVPLIFDRELRDGRLFRNAGEVPRFHSVRRVTKMTRDEFLQRTTSTDFRDEAVITGPDALPATADASIKLASYRNDRQEIEVDAPAGTFLASSEKLTPELAITVDGKAAKSVETNLIFAGVRVPPGRHSVVFARRLARGWWFVCAAALLAAAVLSVLDFIEVGQR